MTPAKFEFNQKWRCQSVDHLHAYLVQFQRNSAWKMHRKWWFTSITLKIFRAGEVLRGEILFTSLSFCLSIWPRVLLSWSALTLTSLARYPWVVKWYCRFLVPSGSTDILSILMASNSLLSEPDWKLTESWSPDLFSWWRWHPKQVHSHLIAWLPFFRRNF